MVNMARPLRLQYPGALYHVISRGNERRDIFEDDSDRAVFLDILKDVWERYRWLCYAYCLMDNHYHLLIETPQANLVVGMRQLNGVYAQRYNRRHRRVGHLFQGRYKSVLVDKEEYLVELSRYIVSNPVRAGMVEEPGLWRWSSYRATAGYENPPCFLDTGLILSLFSLDRQSAQRSYRMFVTSCPVNGPLQPLSKDTVLGDDPFRKRIDSLMADKETHLEVPRPQRFVWRPPLTDLFDPGCEREERNQRIYMANTAYGYSMKEIADHLELHYSTVSKVIMKRRNNNPGTTT